MSRARRTYNRTWRKYDQYYGAEGQPAPLVNLKGKQSSGAVADTFANAEGNRYVRMPRHTIRELAGKDDFYSKEAQNTLAHEWAHIFQNDDLLQQDDRNALERQTSEFARGVGRRQNTKARIRVARDAGDKRKVRRLRTRNRNRTPLNTAQFSDYAGADPTTIKWPTE